MRLVALRCAAPSLVLIALVLLPFLGKAFTMDDAVFMYEARHATVDPLHPSAFDIVWGPVRARASDVVSSGTLMAWILVPAALSSHPEHVAHLAQLALLALAALATVSLALRLGLGTRWATMAGVLLASTPAALPMAGTAMPDVPSMALGVVGIERLVAWKDRAGWVNGVVAALMLGLAPLARAHLLLLVGVGALVIARDGIFEGSWRRERLKVWAPLMAAPLVTAAVLFLTRDRGGAAPQLAGAIATSSGLEFVPRNGVGFFVHWVLAAPFAIAWVALRPRRIRERAWVLVGLAAAMAALLALATEDSWMLPAAPIGAFGAAMLLDVLLDAWKRRDGTQLVLGAWLFVSLPIAIYLHLPPKYLLASAPAAALLLARDAATRAPSRRSLAALGAVCVAGVALGVAILRADAALAGLGRRAAEELITPNVAAGRRVWITPQWGFQWYASNAGATIATIDPPYPRPGDLLLTAQRTHQSPAVQELYRQRFGPRAMHLQRVTDERPGGRVSKCESSVSFYSTSCGYLPWGWSTAPVDAFDLWEIR